MILEAPSGVKHIVGIVKKTNNILTKYFKKRREDYLDKPFKLSIQSLIVNINIRLINYLGYSLTEILYRVKPISTFERGIIFSSFPAEISLLDLEEILLIV